MDAQFKDIYGGKYVLAMDNYKM